MGFYGAVKLEMNLLASARSLLREALKIARERVVLLSIGAAFVACAALALHRVDVAWSDALLRHRVDSLRNVARRVSASGDFASSLGVALLVGGAGFARKSARWKQAALASLLAACLAGATATTIRTLTGRPRPSAGRADGFYGPVFSNHRMQSFPSAHSATSLGTATAVAVAAPEIGVPLLALAFAVPWSRFYLHDHYITDVTVGSAIGILFGLLLGLAARRISAGCTREA